jgi:hypothetical protein
MLGSDKIGECSVEEGEKIGDIQAAPKTFHKNAYAPNPNPLRNKLDTTPDPPIFPHQTNDFQKPINSRVTWGMSSLGRREKKRVRRNQKRNQVSSPNPSLNLNSCDFIVTIVGEMVTRVSFASRGSVRRSCVRSGLTRTSTTPLNACEQISLGKSCPSK